MGLNPSYRTPTKRRRAIPSDHSDVAVLLYAVSQMAVRLGRYRHTAVIFRRQMIFRFMAVTTSAEAVKPKYGGNFSAAGGFSFFGGNDFGGGGKIKIWR